MDTEELGGVGPQQQAGGATLGQQLQQQQQQQQGTSTGMGLPQVATQGGNSSAAVENMDTGDVVAGTTLQQGGNTTAVAAPTDSDQQKQQQQQQQQEHHPAPHLPAVAYALLAAQPQLEHIFFTPTQRQQGGVIAGEEDTHPTWPYLPAPGAFMWGNLLRQLVGSLRGVGEDWDPGDTNAAGDCPLTSADAVALGPAFWAAFPELVYAGPPEDRLGSVPREVVVWVRAWLQQRGYAVYLGYE
jgi:hypothetical protein